MENEKRLIDANAVDYENIMCSQSQLHWLNAIIEKQPTVDAVEVVRCEHCICGLSDGWICGGPGFTMPSHPTYPNAFCSYGERRNNE